MFTKIKLIAISIIVTIMTSSVIAHDGHDHSNVNSGIIHLTWLAPILIAAAFVGYRIRKNKLKNEEK